MEHHDVAVVGAAGNGALGADLRLVGAEKSAFE
jgi:hypothetical protein